MIRINGYPIDAALEESLSYEADITENEVEKGSDITDHVRPKLPVISFSDAVVSDTPIGKIATDETRVSNANLGVLPSLDAFQRFKELHEAATTCIVECSYGRFEDMVLATLTSTKNAKNKKSFTFNATFRNIRIVENTRTTVRVATQAGGKKQSKGLSLDNVVEGNKVLWRKGNPPGKSPSTDPPGVIVGQETVYVIKGHYYHEDKRRQLTTQELTDFTADLNRDTALYQRRQLARIDQRIDATGQKIERAIQFADAKQANPGANITPEMFGL